MKRLPPENMGSLVDEKVRSAIEHFAERIAHDYNNIITPLLAYPDMLMTMIPDESCQNLVRCIQESAEHAMTMTQKIGSLAGGTGSEAKSFDLGQVTGGVLAGMKERSGLAGGIVIRDDLAAGCRVIGQQDAFTTALEALLDNAVRAVRSAPGGGSIDVVLKPVRTDCLAGIGGERIPEGMYYMLEVRDTGAGIKDEDIRFAVEPFFTGASEQGGCGSGLGLSIAYCGLRRNGAYLQLGRAMEGGTRAQIYFGCPSGTSLPDNVEVIRADKGKITSAAQSVASFLSAGKPQGMQASCGVGASEKRRVLVVDDERSIVNLFKMILENFIPGIAVDKAENGQQALELFKETRHSVLVMDLHMPVMDGQSAFFEIEKYCRESGIAMPSVVFCTGYAPQAPLRNAVGAEPRHALLNKPVQSEVLVRTVRERLELVP